MNNDIRRSIFFFCFKFCPRENTVLERRVGAYRYVKNRLLSLFLFCSLFINQRIGNKSLNNWESNYIMYWPYDIYTFFNEHYTLQSLAISVQHHSSTSGISLSDILILMHVTEQIHSLRSIHAFYYILPSQCNSSK